LVWSFLDLDRVLGMVLSWSLRVGVCFSFLNMKKRHWLYPLYDEEKIIALAASKRRREGVLLVPSLSWKGGLISVPF